MVTTCLRYLLFITLFRIRFNPQFQLVLVSVVKSPERKLKYQASRPTQRLSTFGLHNLHYYYVVPHPGTFVKWFRPRLFAIKLFIIPIAMASPSSAIGVPHCPTSAPTINATLPHERSSYYVPSIQDGLYNRFPSSCLPQRSGFNLLLVFWLLIVIIFSLLFVVVFWLQQENVSVNIPRPCWHPLSPNCGCHYHIVRVQCR